MFTTTTNKTMEIKQDDHSNNKFFSSLLSKENSVANPSFRVYYGGVSGSIPFTWESQPGTPKHALLSVTSLVPPLTPPPSYYTKSNPKPNKKHSRSGLMHALFRKMMSLQYLKKNNVVPRPSSSASSLSSTSWSWSSEMYRSRRSRFSTPSFDSRVDDEGTAAIGSKSSIRCFIIGRG